MESVGTERRRLGLWGAALTGALTLGAIHLLNVAIVTGAGVSSLPQAVRDVLRGIASHMLVFQVELALTIALAGAVFGVAARLAGLTTRLGVALGALLIGLLACARTIAHKPALFEDLLWRSGGLSARLQVLVAETIGPRRFDYLLLWAALLIGGVALWRARASLTRGRLVIGVGVLAVIGVMAGVTARRHKATQHGTAVIMLVADSLRPDHLSSEGYSRETSPNIDALRKKGAFTRDFVVPLASTIPSWATYLTGVYPHSHGIRDIFPRAEQIGLQLPTLPRILKEHGYETAVVSDYAGDMFSRVRFGFEHTDAPPAMSLEVVAEREALQRLPIALGLLSGAWGERLFPIMRFLTNNADPAHLTDRTIEQLHRLEGTEKPFFLAAFYSVTHLPFAAPMPDGAAWTQPSYSGRSRYSYDLQKLSDIERLAERPPEPEVEQVRALYDGSVRAFDREVGRMLAVLDAEGITDRIVIIAGDHGENLFEPGATTEHGKWFAGGEAANRTVMLLAGTGITPGNIEGPRSGVDFTPTILDLLHLPAPRMAGLSLLTPPDPKRTLFEETTTWLGGDHDRPPHTLRYPDITQLLEPESSSHALVLRRRFSDIAVTAKLRSARQGPWKLVYTPTSDGAEYQLFNVESDPYCQQDVAPKHAEIVADLSRQLFVWMQDDPVRWMDDRSHLVARRER